MKRVFILAISILAVFILSIGILPLGAENAKDPASDSVCDTCHKNPSKYVKHMKAGKYCQECHTDNLHFVHSLNCTACHSSKVSEDFCHETKPNLQVFESGDFSSCESCHTNVITEHPNVSCETCHQNPVKIHTKADKFATGSSGS
ncbi:MAG: hypothetical protein H0Z28_05075 [Archaeoglobus sp.]|nr:hypothetical protein [Archaeoglobus sp.]